MKYKVWSNELDFEKTYKSESEDMNLVLDKAAEDLGYIDYADLMQKKNWNSENGDGLNIKETKQEK